MKLFIFYSCLLAIMIQAISASTSSDEPATLTSKGPSGSMAKKVTAKSVRGRKVPSATTKSERVCETGKGDVTTRHHRKCRSLAFLGKTCRSGKIKSNQLKSIAHRICLWLRLPVVAKCCRFLWSKYMTSDIVARKDKPKSLSEILPKTLVEIVISYFKDDDTYYSILVSTHDWLLQDEPEIAVDGARVYVMSNSEGIQSWNHSFANLKEDEHRCMELDDLQRFYFREFSSSHDGRYVFFGHRWLLLTDNESRIIIGSRWLTQGNELEGLKPKSVAFDGESLLNGVLSRDGQTLCSYNDMTKVARIYQVMEKTGKDSAAFMKFEFNGIPLAVSGKGKRVMVENAYQLEIHDIGKDTSDMVCRVDAFGSIGALNEDGSEAAFVASGVLLRIVYVDKVARGKVESAIVTVQAPASLGEIAKLVYSNGNKLHALHPGGKVSLFDPSKKRFILIETPEKGQKIVGLAISPDADYIATIQRAGEEEKGDGKRLYKTVVKQRFGSVELMNVFGYETDEVASSREQAKSPSDEHQ